MVFDEPTTWTFDNQEWSPGNYDDEYDGGITLRRALAMSRNIATIKVAEQTGYDRVVALWKKTKVGQQDVQAYPSVALGTVGSDAARAGRGLHGIPRARHHSQAAHHHQHRQR